MDSIVKSFDDIVIEGVEYSFGHLVPFAHSLEKAGRENSDVRVRVSYQSHVFSRSCEAGTMSDFMDEGGRGRVFCEDRYNASTGLPDVCRRMLDENFLTWEAQDRNGVSNMAVIDGELVTGNHTAIIYYLFPSQVEGLDVELVVKSAYEKEIDFSHIKRRFKVVQLVKTCYYKGQKVPK